MAAAFGSIIVREGWGGAKGDFRALREPELAGLAEAPE